MRTLLLSILLCLPLCADNVPRMIFSVGGGGTGGGGETPITYTLQDENSAARTSDSSLAKNSGADWLAQKFTAGSSYTCTKIELPLFMTGSISGNVYVAIYSHDAGEDDPDTLVGGVSAAVSLSTLPVSGDGTWVSFTLSSGAALTSGSTYWIVVYTDNFGDTSNYVNWERISATDMVVKQSGTGTGTWASYSTTRKNRYKTYSGS
jgi:hypothetical protein